MSKQAGYGLRGLLFALGLLCTALAVAGIFLPLLPTVPLLLLAAACFARSSERFHARLLGHPRLGPMIAGYLDGRGIPLRARNRALLLLWLSIAVSAWFVPLPWVRLLLFFIAAAVSLYLLRLPLMIDDKEGARFETKKRPGSLQEPGRFP